MNIAVILSTLIISASTMNSPGDNSQSPLFAPPTSDLPLPPIQDKTTSQQAKSKSGSAAKSAQQRSTQRLQTRTSRTAGSSGRVQQQNAQNMPPLMPIAPTDSAAGMQVGRSYQWLPPTANAGSDADGGGRPSGSFGPMSVPTSPTRARPGQPQSYTSMQNAEQQNRRMQAARNAAAAPAQVASKPFSGVAQQSAGISPYMNLFRAGSNNGTIDNYSTLVRPVVDQRRTNQQFGSDIHGLENSTHVQGLNIRQLNRETQNLQGVNATQYFMNYGDYYQGTR